MDENKRCRVTCENQPARRRGSNKFAADSSLEEDGFERAVPPRRESLRGAAPGKHRRLGPEPVSASAFRAAVSDWQRPEEPSQERDRWFESGSLQQRVMRTRDLKADRGLLPPKSLVTDKLRSLELENVLLSVLDDVLKLESERAYWMSLT